MKPFSCLLIGNESLLVGCGDALLDHGHDIRGIVSKDRDILDWATAKNLPVIGDIAALKGQFKRGDFDWLFSIANLELIPDDVLALPALGALNFHDGPLPRYAGLNTPVWALFNGETRYGVTWHILESGVDTGDIVEQVMFDIAKDETAFSLNSKCYAAAMDSFASVMTGLGLGQLARTPQSLSERSYFARDDRPETAGRLDFTKSTDDLARIVRALDFGDYWNPLLCAKIELAGQVVLVGTATPVADDFGATPGTVLECDKTSLTVATADGALRLDRLTGPDGERIDPSILAAVAHVLPTADAPEKQRLDACITSTLKGEAHWRKALQDLQPVSVPLASHANTNGADWASFELALPGEFDQPTGLAVVMVWALRSAGQDQADLAFCDSDIAAAAQTAPGYVSHWVPLRISRSEQFDCAVERLTNDLARIGKIGGFASDLIARDPLISQTNQPDIAIAIGHSNPIDGSCLTIALTNTPTITVHFDRTRLSDESAALLANRLEHLAKTIAKGDIGQQTIDTLPILPTEERQQIVTRWNRTVREFDQSLTIHRAFEEQVARTPDATALVFENTELSYRALNERANAVAQHLAEMGVKPGTRVALFVPRSTDLLIGALAILKAGGAYVPLDPAYPADRTEHYLNDSGAAVVITRNAMQGDLPKSNAKPLILDQVAGDVGANVDGGAGPDDLAYLIYTSGSTGNPKGVIVEHKNVANFFAGMDDRIDHDQGDVWLAVTSLSFDISVLELFWTLARGFKVVLNSDEDRAVMSNQPLAISDRKIDFNLFFWGNDDGPGPRKYQLLLDGARFADANGFNAIWTPERHFHAFGGPYPNPAVTGAAVAAVTSNLSVRSGSCVAPLHHPARIAEDWAIIDNLTDGRAGLGIAAGWQPHDFVLRPENSPPDNKPAMFEAIEMLRRLWRGDEVEFPLKDGTMHAVVTQPRPVSKELPIWVTIAGNPETWKEAGQIGANVLTHLLGQSIDEVADKIKIYHAALREAGHDPKDFTVSLMLHTYIAETREEAERVARGPMKEYMGSAAGLIKQFAWVFPAFKRPKGVNNAFEMDLGILDADEVDAILDFAFERYFQDSGLFGTIEDALARTEQLKRIGVDEISCLIDYGIAPELVMQGLEPLAEVLKLGNAPSELAEDDYSLAAQITRHKVTHLQCTPSMARIITSNDEARVALGQVKHLLLGGEALSGDLVQDLKSCTKARISNMYGPTETTIWSTSGDAAASKGIVSIGTPIANTSAYILDPLGQPVPIGVAGDLCIGGAGVTRGYWQRSALTAESFPPDPFAAEAGQNTARMYRTGDVARWQSDGTIAFVGRSDHQVKIRGQRIELGEIDATLAGFAGVKNAISVVHEFGPGDHRLVAYVATSDDLSETAIKAQLGAKLPKAMVPAQIVMMDALPLTPNKKIDRATLPDPTQTRRASTGPVAAVPGPGTEAGIAAIWASILGVGDIRSNDNFFDLGGHSLLAVQAHRAIREKLNLPKLSITDIFRFPTLGALAAHLGDAGDQPPKTPVKKPNSKRRAMRAERQAKTG
jgi:natural product biosynthesis luciferase-like monooxygenase protein